MEFHFSSRKESMVPSAAIGDILARNNLLDVTLDNGSSAACTMSTWWSWLEEGISLDVLELRIGMAGVARPKSDRSPPETGSTATWILYSSFLSCCVREMVCKGSWCAAREATVDGAAREGGKWCDAGRRWLLRRVH